MGNLLIQILLPASVTLILIGADEIVFKAQLVHPFKWGIFAFMIFLSYISKKITDLIKLNDQIKFFNYYVLSMFVRILLVILFLWLMLIRQVGNVPLFIGNFFLFYFCFFVFEIYYLITNLQADSKR
jgi:pheromone shutdown protein TraB